MPFPWKKNRVTRISQIVADLQSPKRGASLVVETGFPTSLIDLFVKNRTRFRKPKSKNRVHLEASDPPPPPPPSETSSFSGCTVVFSEPRRAEAPSLSRLVAENVHGDDGVAGSGPEVNRVGECGGGSDSNTVLAASWKMFVVVVLILCVKKLTVGITMSAFALLFLEYAGKRVVSCFRPCSNANMGIIESLSERVPTRVWFQKLLLKIKKNGEGSDSEPVIVHGEIVMSELVVGAECSSNSLSFEEIEVVESKSEFGFCCEETCFAGPEFDCANGDKKWGCPEMQEESKGKVVEPCGISECKTKGSRSVKFKSKLVKKLVPKRLRGYRKEKKEMRSKESEAESSSEGSSTVKEDNSLSFEIEEEQDDVGKEEEDIGNRSTLLLKIKLECIREDEVDHGITCSQESLLVRKEVAVNNEEKRMDRVGNSGYIIIFVIALAGLVVGRVPALILTVTWCFMLKIVTTRGRSRNVPLIKCTIPKSS